LFFLESGVFEAERIILEIYFFIRKGNDSFIAKIFGKIGTNFIPNES